MANKQLRKRHDRKKPRRNPGVGKIPPGVYKVQYVVDEANNDSYYVLNSFTNTVSCPQVVEMRKNEKGEWEK